MAFIQPVRPGAWGKFSTPQVVNKTIISGSFNNYGGGFGVGMPPMMGGGMMVGGYDYGCYGGCGGGMKPFWGGFLGGFLGGVLNFFGGGGSRVSDSSSVYSYQQGPGGPGDSGNDPTAKLKDFLGKDYSVMYDNGKYTVRTPDNKILTGDSTDDIISQLQGGSPSTKQATLTGDGRETALKELREEATKFNSNNGKDGFALSVNDNPTGDKTKGTDLQYTLTYTDSKGNAHTSEFKTVPTPGELKQFKDGIEAKITGGAAPVSTNPNGNTQETNPNGGNGKGAVAPKSEFDDVFSKFPEGYKYVDGKGVEGPDGSIYKTPANLLAKLSSGHTPVNSKDFDINTLNGQNIIAHDEGDPVDITGDVSVDASKNTITINGHTYNIVQNSGQFVFFNDPSAKNSNGGGQTYILEKTPSGDYRLSQYEFLKRTDADDGYNIAAH